MGAWGTGIYQDDVAGDIKQDYISKQKAGKSEETALKEVLEENAAEFEDDDDRYGAWCALADTMWKYGRLTEEVKRKALEVIEEEKACIDKRWEVKKDAAKRGQVLDKLRGQLLSEQPPKKRISVHKPYVPKWKKGDVYQYEITDIPDYCKFGQEYKGWFVLIYVWGFVECELTVKGVKDLLSVMYMKLSEHRISSPSEINDVQGWCSCRGLKYRVETLETSNRFLKDLEYVGGCSDFMYPEDEIVAEEKDYSILISMSKLGEDAIEGYLLEKYERERYKTVGYATGLSPREQVRYYRNMGVANKRKYHERAKRRRAEMAGIPVPDGEREGCGYICPWEVCNTYRYRIEDTPAGMEKYKGWYLIICVYQMRGIKPEGRNKPDIVPDIFVHVVDGEFNNHGEMKWLRDYMPFACFSWDGGTEIGVYKAVIEGMPTEKTVMDRIEDTKETCWWRYFPDAECEGAEPERLNWDNFVEKSLEGYERELQRLEIDRKLGTLDVIKRYIEVMGGIDREMLE